MRWEKFLNDEKGEPSSTRLGLFISIGFLGFALVLQVSLGRPEAGITATALAGLAGTAFVGGKMSADSVVKTQMQNSSPPPGPPPEIKPKE